MPHRLTFPSAGADSGLRMRVIPAAEQRQVAFTATGIAPDFHRTSLLMTQGVNHDRGKDSIFAGKKHSFFR